MAGLPALVRLLSAALFLIATVPVSHAQVRPPASVQGAPKPKAAPLPRPAPRSQAARLKVVPLPVPRPKGIDGPAVSTAPTPAQDEAVTGVCMAKFTERGGEILPRPSQEPAAGPEEACTIPGPLTFAQVKLKDGGVVRLESPVTVRCSLALVLADWIREDLAPTAEKAGTVLTRLIGVGGHACRTRNGQPGAQISEHASGNAFDLLALGFKDGRTIELWQDAADTKDMRTAVRESACARFTTVLGPGADSAHANHIHMDLRERSNGYRMCQWDVK